MMGIHHKPTLRDQLGLLDIPTVLIVGGGDGMGGIVAQAKAVCDKLESLASSSSANGSPVYQMVVVCGKNKSAHSTLSPPETIWGSNVSVKIQGFVNKWTNTCTPLTL